MHHHITRRMAATAAAMAIVAGGIGLSACGSSDSSGSAAATTAADSTAQAPNGIETLSAQEILDTSLKAAQKASSVTVTGGFPQGSGALELDMVLGTNQAEGTISVEGVALDLKVVGGKSYFKAPGEAFKELAGDSGGAIAALIGDKWLVISTDSAGEAGGLGEFGELGQKDSLLEGILEGNGAVTIRGTGTVNGIPVVLIDFAEGDGTLAISTVGEPYPLQVKSSGKSADSGEVNFTNWNAPVNVTAPTDVVDLSALADLGGSSTSSN